MKLRRKTEQQRKAERARFYKKHYPRFAAERQELKRVFKEMHVGEGNVPEKIRRKITIGPGVLVGYHQEKADQGEDEKRRVSVKILVRVRKPIADIVQRMEEKVQIVQTVEDHVETSQKTNDALSAEEKTMEM